MPVRYPAPGPSPLRLTVLVAVLLGLGTGIAVMATPGPDRPSGGDEERAVLQVLRDLTAAQRAFAEAKCIDTDGDGRGEFGFLAELAGGARLRIDGDGRLGPQQLETPLLPIDFAAVQGRAVVCGGYLVQVYLPGRDGAWIAEADEGGGAGLGTDADLAELQLRAYAWPLPDCAGQRAFCIDATGTVRACANGDRRYEGRDRPVPPHAVDTDAAAWQPLP